MGTQLKDRRIVLVGLVVWASLSVVLNASADTSLSALNRQVEECKAEVARQETIAYKGNPTLREVVGLREKKRDEFEDRYGQYALELKQFFSQKSDGDKEKIRRLTQEIKRIYGDLFLYDYSIAGEFKDLARFPLAKLNRKFVSKILRLPPERQTPEQKEAIATIREHLGDVDLSGDLSDEQVCDAFCALVAKARPMWEQEIGRLKSEAGLSDTLMERIRLQAEETALIEQTFDPYIFLNTPDVLVAARKALKDSYIQLGNFKADH